jgi:DNA-binding CsgD family transcriptional regulator
VIRENDHQALQDLREVVGVLRAPVGELPQPTLADRGRGSPGPVGAGSPSGGGYPTGKWGLGAVHSPTAAGGWRVAAEIVDAVRRVAQGRPVLSPAVTRRLIARVAGSGPDRRARARQLLDRLNQREREVAVAVGQGRSNAEIGSVLYLSVPTVKTHVSSILTKLDLNHRVQIALLVHDAGLLDDPGPG